LASDIDTIERIVAIQATIAPEEGTELVLGEWSGTHERKCNDSGGHKARKGSAVGGDGFAL